MPPGDYYIDIVPTHGDLRGSYELEFSNIDEFVQSDPYEPNNSIKRAKEIDTKTNDIVTLKNLSLNSYYDVDTFKFTNIKQADSSHYIKLTQSDKSKLPELGIQIIDEKGQRVKLGHEAQFYTDYGARRTRNLSREGESIIEEYSFNVDNYWTKYVNLNSLPKGEYYISIYAENESDHLFWTNYIVNNKLGRSHSFDKDWSIDDYELTISTPSYGTSIVEDIYEAVSYTHLRAHET